MRDDVVELAKKWAEELHVGLIAMVLARWSDSMGRMKSTIRRGGKGIIDTIGPLISAIPGLGEFVVNAKSTKRHRAMLEAINSGKTVVLAAGGIVNGSTFAPSNTYAPSLAINVTGSGNRNDHLLADRIAGAVDRALKANQPDSFKRTEGQKMGDLANRRRRDGGRYT